MGALWHLDPLVLLLLAFLAVLTIAFFWPGNNDAQGGAVPRRPSEVPPSASIRRRWGIPPGRFPQVRRDAECRAVRQLKAVCGNEYATRFEPARQHVRVF
jgi:hypothetical protein